MSFIEKFIIRFSHQFIGRDEYGNEYYQNKTKSQDRFVVYNGVVEPSKVPPLWHAWLHNMTDEVPRSAEFDRYDWQEDYQPNLSGTKFAYDPNIGNKNVKAAKYQAWNPGKK